VKIDDLTAQPQERWFLGLICHLGINGLRLGLFPVLIWQSRHASALVGFMFPVSIGRILRETP